MLSHILELNAKPPLTVQDLNSNHSAMGRKTGKGRKRKIPNNKALVDMTSGVKSDENNRASASTSTSASLSSSSSNLLTSTTATNTGINRPGHSRNNNNNNNNNSSTSSNNPNKGMSKKAGKRPGRKPAKIDERAKLERSRQSAKECRARKKLRYQYLEELVLNREKAVVALRDEVELFKQWCTQLDAGGKIPDTLLKTLANEDTSRHAQQVRNAKRASQLQQHHEHQQQHEQQQQQQQQQQQLPPAYPSGACSSSLLAAKQQSLAASGEVSPSRLPNLSPTQPDRQQFKGPALKRQLAFDLDNIGCYSDQSQQRQQQQHQQQNHHQQQQQRQQQQRQQQQQIAFQRKRHPQETAVPSTGYNASNPGQMMATSSSQVYVQRSSNLVPPRTNQQQSFGFQSRSLSSVQQQQQQPHHHQQRQQTIPHSQCTQQQQQQQQGNKEKFSFFSQHTPPVTRIQSEPPMKYLRSMPSSTQSQPPPYTSANQTLHPKPEGGFTSADLDLLGLNASQASSGSLSTSRGRSNSNPAYTGRKEVLHQASPTEGGRQVDAIISSFWAKDASKTKSFSLPNTIFPSSSSTDFTSTASNLGLFSGRPLTMLPSVSSINSSELSSTVAMDDSSSYSSDENTAQMPLFQSSIAPSPKRALSDPVINQTFSQEVSTNILNASYNSDNPTFVQDYNSQKSYADPHKKLNNLTTVHCLSSTNTLNTPSPSPFMMVPRNTDSPLSVSPGPSSSMGYPNTTPSSSNTPSPAPLSFKTSLLEEDSAMEVNTPSSFGAFPTTITTTTTTPGASAVICSETGLSATISEYIPGLYSILDELEEVGIIPKQTVPEVPVTTTVSKFQNVPNFLN